MGVRLLPIQLARPGSGGNVPPASAALSFVHVDVFAPRPFTGNSLAVFPHGQDMTAGQMAAITRELRHFESVFLVGGEGPRSVRARVFDMFQELDFAGHPVLGAACVLHYLDSGGGPKERWAVRLAARAVTVETRRLLSGGFMAWLDQGPAEFAGAVEGLRERDRFARALGLAVDDLLADFGPEVVSTGLRYLVLPVRSGALARARISHPELGAMLASVGAQFVYVLDPEAMEGRHWNNDGVVEDVATGSGAGCVAALLRRHDRIPDGGDVVLRQGRFVGRPSELRLRAHGAGQDVHSVEVGGEVAIVGDGRLIALPPTDGEP
jgi:PhzF family phenazine biosynthesis protein